MKTTFFISILLLAAQQLISAHYTAQTETPEYKVVANLGDVEIRSYPALVLASTDMGTGTYSSSSGKGFRTVAGYIFGGNDNGEKISMTSPVMVEMSDTMRMSFIMPADYSMQSLPQPNDPEVNLESSPARILAVIRYGGFSNDQRYESHRAYLESILKENNVQYKGPFLYFGYNPPYELVNRRNEVAVEVIWPGE